MAQKAPGVLKLNRIHTTKDKKGLHPISLSFTLSTSV
jgi:hypothetical protein